MHGKDAVLRSLPKGKHNKRRRPWRRLFLCLLLLLGIALAASLPRLLSTPTGQRWLRDTLASRLSGDLDFRQLDLSWRRGLTVEGFQWHDANETARISVHRVQANPRLLALFKGELSLGTLVLERPAIRVTGIPQWPWTAPDGQPPTEPEPPETDNEPAWRLRDMHIRVEDGSLHIRHEGVTTDWRELNLDIQVPETGTARLQAGVLAAGAGPTGRLRLAAESARPWVAGSETGSLQFDLETLDLQHLDSILTLIGRPAVLRGTVDGSARVRWESGRLGEGRAQLQAHDLAITAPALAPDTLASTEATVTARLSHPADGLAVELNLESDVLEGRIDGMWPGKDLRTADLRQASWMGDFRIDLPVLARQFRQTLKLREGVDVTDGRLEAQWQWADRRMLADLELAGLQGTFGGRVLRLSEALRAHTRFRWQQAALDLEELRIEAPFATGDLSGDREQLAYRFEVDLASLYRECGAFLDLGAFTWQGSVLTRATLRKQDAQWTWNGSADLRDLRVADPNGRQVLEPHLHLDHRISYDAQRRALGPAFGTLRARWGTLTLEPAAYGTDAAGGLRIRGQGLDLAELAPWAVLAGALEDDLAVTGALDVHAALARDGDTLHIVTRDLQATQLRVQRPGQPAFEQDRIGLQLRARLNRQSGAMDIDTLTLEAEPLTLRDTRFQKTVHQEEVRLEGRTRCQYDWDALHPLIRSWLPEGLRLRGQRDDTVLFSAAYPEGSAHRLGPQVTAGVTLGFDSASYRGLEVGPTDVNLVVEQGMLVLSPFVSTVNEGELRFGCRADLGQRPLVITCHEPMSLARDIHITGPLAENLLKYVNPIFADLANISGRLDYESRDLVWPAASEDRDALTVIGTIAMRDVRLEGSALLSQILALFDLKPVREQRLAVRPTAFTVQKGIVRYEDMQIDIGDNPLNFSGAIGLDDSLDMVITLPYTWSGRTARVDRPAGDRIQIPLTGSLSEPRLDTERFLKDQLRQQIEKQIHKGLEELFERL